MKARLALGPHPAVLVTAVSDKPLDGAVTLPSGLLNSLAMAQASLDAAEVAVVRHLRDTGQMPADLAPRLERRWQGRVG